MCVHACVRGAWVGRGVSRYLGLCERYLGLCECVCVVEWEGSAGTLCVCVCVCVQSIQDGILSSGLIVSSAMRKEDTNQLFKQKYVEVSSSKLHSLQEAAG